MIELQFEQLPALLPCYLRALLFGRRADRLDDVAIPEIRAVSPGLIADPDRLTRFRRLLELADDGVLPPTFPQVLAAPLHLSLLTAKEFPLRVTGLVHLSNTIHYTKPIDQRQKIDLGARVEAGPQTSRGIELNLETTAFVDGESHWQASALLLAGLPARGKHRTSKIQPAPDLARQVDAWRAGSDTGRRYAAVSGDYNPIHLYGATARLFGFKAPIAHGMWSLGRSLAGLRQLLQPPFVVEARFRRPMLLPAEVCLLLDDRDQPTFSVVDTKTKKAYLTGAIA